MKYAILAFFLTCSIYLVSKMNLLLSRIHGWHLSLISYDTLKLLYMMCVFMSQNMFVLVGSSYQQQLASYVAYLYDDNVSPSFSHHDYHTIILVKELYVLFTQKYLSKNIQLLFSLKSRSILIPLFCSPWMKSMQQKVAARFHRLIFINQFIIISSSSK